MNIVVIMLDSLRQDHVSAYGKGRVFDGVEPCRTPNIDAFAREAVVFDNACPMGLPTIPVRTELFTGQTTLPFKGWEPLSSIEMTAAEILGREGYTCGLVTDTYHFRAPGMNFHRGFHSYEHIRGQEYDPWSSAAPRRDVNDYVNDRYTEQFKGLVAKFLANTDGFARDEDWFAARVMETACSWLRANRPHGKTFLWIDSFEPHEPWDPPKRFDTYTDPDWRGKRLILPMGGPAADWASPGTSGTSAACTRARSRPLTSGSAGCSPRCATSGTTMTPRSCSSPITATPWRTTASSSRARTACTGSC